MFFSENNGSFLREFHRVFTGNSSKEFPGIILAVHPLILKWVPSETLLRVAPRVLQEILCQELYWEVFYEFHWEILDMLGEPQKLPPGFPWESSRSSLQDFSRSCVENFSESFIRDYCRNFTWISPGIPPKIPSRVLSAISSGIQCMISNQKHRIGVSHEISPTSPLKGAIRLFNIICHYDTYFPL